MLLFQEQGFLSSNLSGATKLIKKVVMNGDTKKSLDTKSY